MRLERIGVWLLCLSIVLIIPIMSVLAQDNPAKAALSTTAKAEARTDINWKAPEWQVVLNRLFGTPNDGLLDGTAAFQFRAKDVILTKAQSDAFFTSSARLVDLETLIEATEKLHGVVHLAGTIDGSPFELKISGRQLKLEGLTLTESQRLALAAELGSIDGLHEARVTALVDGRKTVTRIQGNRDRLALAGRTRVEAGSTDGRGRVDVSSAAKVDGVVKIDRVDKVDKVDRVDKAEPPRVDRPARVDVGGGAGASTIIDRPVRLDLPGRR